jgi:hypothetical protein
MALDVKDGNNVSKTLKTTLDGADHVAHHIIDNLPTNPASDEAIDDLGVKQDATNTALGDILAKIIVEPATEAKQDLGNASLSSIDGKLTPVTGIPSDDTDSSALPIRALPMHTSRIGYTKVISGGVDTEWGTTVILGTGMAVNQTGGNLVVTSGTTARSETIIRSIASWKGGIRLRNRVTLSQRIVNNNFFLELVDVIGDGLAYTITSATNINVTFTGAHGFTAQNIGQSMYLGAFAGTGTFLSGRYPIAAVAGDVISFTVSGFAAGSGTCSAFGWNYYQLQYQGTTATSVNFDTQRNGWAVGATAATVNTSTSPGHLVVVTGNDLIATLSDQLVATATTIAQSVRATRAENVPDDVNLRFQIRIANGSTAPASTTTLTLGMTSVSNYANQDVVLQDVRPMTNAQALPVEILRSTSLSVGTVSTVTSLTTLANGQTAHSSASTGSPVRVGGRVKTANDTTLVAGDASDMAVTTDGAQVMKPYSVPEVDWVYAAAGNGIVNTTTAVTIKTAAGAGLRNYMTGIQLLSETLGAATEVAVRDGAGGTVIWRTKLSTAAQPLTTIIFPNPLKGTANTLLEVVTLSASVTGAVYFNAQGYIAP